MRAAVFHAVGKPLVVENVPDPIPASDQVILQVANAGICGSDLHMVENPNMTPGIILGHEFAGTIAAIGSAVTGQWKVGDRVTALPLNACHDCAACDANLLALCPDNLFTGRHLCRAHTRNLSARVQICSNACPMVGLLRKGR